MSDDERAFVVRYLSLIRLAAAHRVSDLCEVFNVLRWIVRVGPLAHVADQLPDVGRVYQQTRHWLESGRLRRWPHNLRELCGWAAGRKVQPMGPSSTAPRGN